eukprot:767945-Hanusia_phi.AAC.4
MSRGKFAEAQMEIANGTKLITLFDICTALSSTAAQEHTERHRTSGPNLCSHVLLNQKDTI